MQRSLATAVGALALLAACGEGARPRSIGDGSASDAEDHLGETDADVLVSTDAMADADVSVISVTTDAMANQADGSETGVPIVHAWLTTPDLASHLTQQPDVETTPSGAADLTFDDSSRLQTIDGFGAALTDTSAYLLVNALTPTTRAQVMADLFSRTTGIGLSLVRLPMGSSDFTDCSCTYSYDDGVADPTLAGFSTAHDDAYIIPGILQAQSINPQMKFFANPWSPPAWMKTNGSMLGTVDGGAGTLQANDDDPLAQYFVRFLQDYIADGVSVWAITPQNEPSVARDYPGMSWSASDEADFIANHLAPALADAGLADIKILGGDDVGASLSFAQTLFANAGSSLYATAWHCYHGLGDMTAIHDAYPDTPLYMTECSTGASGIAGDATEQVLVSMANWASGAVLWNIALDTNGGPKMGEGCVGCTGLVTIDSSSGATSYTLNYYELAQFSKFVAPGAERVAHAGGNGISAEAFRNPDGTYVLVAYNPGDASVTFSVRWDNAGSFRYALAAGATVTFTSLDAGM